MNWGNPFHPIKVKMKFIVVGYISKNSLYFPCSNAFAHINCILRKCANYFMKINFSYSFTLFNFHSRWQQKLILTALPRPPNLFAEKSKICFFQNRNWTKLTIVGISLTIAVIIKQYFSSDLKVNVILSNTA